MADGGVLFSSDSEVYFGLNPVGAIIWEALPGATTIEELCRTLSQKYTDVAPEVLARDVNNFLRDLLAAGLVIVPTDAASAGPDAGAPR